MSSFDYKERVREEFLRRYSVGPYKQIMGDDASRDFSRQRDSLCSEKVEVASNLRIGRKLGWFV